MLFFLYTSVRTNTITTAADFSMPTFIIFKNKEIVESIRGAVPLKLSAAVKKLAAEADSDDGAGGFTSNSGSGTWTAFEAPKGYGDVTSEVDVRGLDLLNANTDFGAARVLFNSSKPSALNSKGKNSQKNGDEDGKDWVESDTDEQLMLYVPFMSTMKVHSLYITSLPPNEAGEGQDGDGIPMRPKELKLYSNRPNVLGFDETEDVPATQEVTLNERDWDEKSGTAKVELRFVKFQNVKSLVIFVVTGYGEGEKTRVDRIRIVGESGEKRDQGKLEKVGHDD